MNFWKACAKLESSQVEWSCCSTSEEVFCELIMSITHFIIYMADKLFIITGRRKGRVSSKRHNGAVRQLRKSLDNCLAQFVQDGAPNKRVHIVISGCRAQLTQSLEGKCSRWRRDFFAGNFQKPHDLQRKWQTGDFKFGLVNDKQSIKLKHRSNAKNTINKIAAVGCKKTVSHRGPWGGHVHLNFARHWCKSYGEGGKEG